MVGIICPLFGIGLTDLPKTGGWEAIAPISPPSDVPECVSESVTVSSSILLTALNDACRPNRDPWLNVIIGPDDQPHPSLCCKGQSLKRGDFDVHLILIEGGEHGGTISALVWQQIESIIL